MLTLDQIPLHQEVRLLNFKHHATGFRHKLLAMGLTPGVMMVVTSIAPLGDPVQVRLRGYTLSLRKNECQKIEVEIVNVTKKCVTQHSSDHCACRQPQLRKDHAF